MEIKTVLLDRRFLLAARFALLILLPFLLGAFVFPHSQHLDGSVISTPDKNQNAADVISYSFSASGYDTLLNQGVGSIFPLSNYLDYPPFVSRERLMLCFQDNGSTILLPNGTEITPDLQWKIYVNNDPPILLNSGAFACTHIPTKGPAVYAWKASINTGIPTEQLNGTVIFNPATLTYPRLEINYGLLQGLVMIPVFYLLIWYPLAGIWKKLREGMGAQ